jgi:DNA-binding CsgD family transcriptional regulator
MRWPCVRERLRDALGAEGYRSIVGEVADGDARSAFASHATSLAPPVAHRDDRKADASDTGLLERLLPHLDRCRQIQVRLTTGAIRIGGLVAALDRLPLAILLLDRGARVVHVNRCAEQLLRAGDGLAIRDGRVTATSRPETERLQRLIAAAACTRRIPGPGSMMALPRPTLGGELCVLVAPLPPGALPGDRGAAAVLLLARDRAGPAPVTGAHLIELYGLTAAEARVATSLLAADGPREVAARLGIGLATVRTHLHRLFAKTGTRRQAELVWLLATLALL